MDNDDLIVKSRDFLVTETEIRTNAPLAEVEHYLKTEKTFGEVKIPMSQGGKLRVLVTEKTKALTEEESKDVRERLGMNTETA